MKKKNNAIPTALNTGALELSVDSLLVASCFSAARFPPLTFLARVLLLPLVSLPIVIVSTS